AMDVHELHQKVVDAVLLQLFLERVAVHVIVSGRKLVSLVGHPYWFPYFLRLSSCALRMTLSSVTAAPPWRLLSSAASMNANSSMGASGLTGALPVRKTLQTSTPGGW